MYSSKNNSLYNKALCATNVQDVTQKYEHLGLTLQMN